MESQTLRRSVRAGNRGGQVSAAQNAEWTALARALFNRYPDDFIERFQSYKDGTNPDLRTWRAIGGEPYVKPPPEARKRGRPSGFTVIRPADAALEARNARIAAAARTGTPLGLIAERFDLSPKTISAILSGLGERAIR